ncbi:MAG: hypothetical protein ABIP94_04270 [Planctomycetota bacterium]
MKSLRFVSLSVLMLLGLTLLGACSEAASKPTAAPAAALSKFALTKDPGAAIGVVAAKQKGAVDRIVVQGRVHNITKGFAVMKLMDTALDYCGQTNKEDKCPTPWDYCCDSRDTQIANSLLVEVRGADGRPLPTPSLPNMRLCDLVKVLGKLIVDEHGNPILLADGLFQVERPQLPDYVKWPQ